MGKHPAIPIIVSAKKTGYFITATYRVLDYVNRQTQDLILTCCGREHFVNYKRFGPEARPGYHVHFILSGSGYLQIEDEPPIHLSRGQIFVVRPDIITSYWPDPENPWEYSWVTFEGEKAASYMEKAGMPDGTYARDSILHPEEYSALVEEILAFPELTFANELKRTGLLFSIISLLISSYSSRCYGQSNHYDYSPKVYVAHALDYIHHNYSRLSINDLAREIGINRSYLTSIFKKSVGISPQEYLVKYRLDEGARRLAESSSPIKDIAQEIGYDNPLTFSKIFKSRFGCSPQSYRRQHSQ